MTKKTFRNRKPDVMFLLTFFVGFGVLLTSAAQAGEEAKTSPLFQHTDSAAPSLPGRWLRAFWDLDLADKISNWTPRIEVDSDGDGVNLSHPFGKHGPALQLSSSIPERAERSLRDGGGHQTDVSGGSDAYIFLQKRW